MSKGTLNDAGLDLIFREAHTVTQWTPERVSDALLRQVYDLAKFGPTSFNATPARFLFVVSKEAKEKLKPALMAMNVDKTMAAPVTVVVGYDAQFYEHLPALFPLNPGANTLFSGNAALAETTAFRNSSLQGAYLMIAARALGLDCGPMSGFNPATVEAAFWPEGRVKANFLCNIGYGDDKMEWPRGPRLSFETACQIV
jgi:3-hydroxypropanoate dehydrogenase